MVQKPCLAERKELASAIVLIPALCSLNRPEKEKKVHQILRVRKQKFEITMVKKKTFLLFAAHPDDGDFASAATVAKLTNEGNTVIYCVVTNGEKGVHNVNFSKEALVRKREDEQRAAAKVLGVREVIFLREIDGELENTQELRKKLVRIMRNVKPDIVIAGDPANRRFDSFGRFHRDHRVIAEAVFDAMYPALGSEAFFPELAKEEKILPYQLEEAWFSGTDKPNLFVNIEETLLRKFHALACHESQISDTQAMEKRVKERAREMGRKKGMRYAEGFRRLVF